MFYEPVVLIYFAMFVPLVVWAVILVWQWLQLPAVAGEIYDAEHDQGRLAFDVTRDDYMRAYRKANAPRLGLYLFVVGLFSLLIFPFLVAFMTPAATPLYEVAAMTGADSSTIVMADMAGGLLHFLLIMAVYAVILVATLFLYHKRRPDSLNRQLRALTETKS
jgi:hypothetical protein